MIWSELRIETWSDRSLITMPMIAAPAQSTLSQPLLLSILPLQPRVARWRRLTRWCWPRSGTSPVTSTPASPASPSWTQSRSHTVYSIYSASCCLTTGTDCHLCNAMQTSASGLDIFTFNVNNNALKFTNQQLLHGILIIWKPILFQINIISWLFCWLLVPIYIYWIIPLGKAIIYYFLRYLKISIAELSSELDRLAATLRSVAPAQERFSFQLKVCVPSLITKLISSQHLSHTRSCA